MKRTAVLGISMLVAAFTVLPALPARASCAAPPALDEAYSTADIVFKGTVTATGGNERIATVRVEEVWKGSPLQNEVEVRGGPRDENVATSVDRQFAVGVSYLFFPTNTKSPFKDNICTPTRRYKPSLEQLRGPATNDDGFGGGPAPLPSTGAGSVLAWLGAALGAMGAALMMLGRRASRHFSR